jgi:hypothetical protein
MSYLDVPNQTRWRTKRGVLPLNLHLFMIIQMRTFESLSRLGCEMHSTPFESPLFCMETITGPNLLSITFESSATKVAKKAGMLQPTPLPLLAPLQLSLSQFSLIYPSWDASRKFKLSPYVESSCIKNYYSYNL